MADYVEQSITYNGTTLIIYNNRKPDAYAFEDIFDPSNPTSGKYFPSVYSLVIKTDGSLYYVASRDETTFTTTLKPCSFITTDDSTNVNIVSYGNDKFCVYQDIRTDPHKLVVDAKFLVYGNNLVEYALYRTTEDGNEECISMYFGSDGEFFSNRIPVASISEEYPTYKYATNCHTTFDLTEGDPLTLRVFNNLGNVAAELTVFVRNATWLNDLESQSNPIVSLNMTANQVQGDDFYLYAKQDASHLNVQPYLIFADGSKTNISVDNLQCFLYGLEDFSPSYPGKNQKLICKYFLNYKETAVGSTSLNNKRFLTCEKNLLVLSNHDEYTVKLSCIPLWDNNKASYYLRWFAYTDVRDAVHDVTDLVTISADTPFDGTVTKFATEQHLVLNYNLQSIFDSDNEINGTQDIYITLHPSTEYVRYTYRSDDDDEAHVFGADGSIVRRPIICHDTENGTYFIPTSVFMNLDAFLESFYLQADPPYDPKSETVAPTPTHFVVRDSLNGSQLIGGPIPIESYGQEWPTIIGTPSLTGNTVLVEFVSEVTSTGYSLLFGVPVDVVDGTFNDKDNQITWPS